MRMTTARIWAAASTAAALVLDPGAARAQQVDVNPPLPNVLLMIDNSGSMERMIDGSLPSDNASSTCNCDATTGTCNWAAQPTPNRWGTLLQAMTGTFQNGYNCAAMPRTAGSVFANEYQINGVAPYDINYFLPYHRPIAKDPNGACVYAPGTLPGATSGNGVGPSGAGAGGNATDFPSNAIVNNHTYGTAGTKACTFLQFQDGALDSQLDIMRFGLMTFDQDLDPSTGVTAGNKVVTPNAFTGMWSYFPGWNSGGVSPYVGAPANCSTTSFFSVGARNPAAPPWEGRMMPFPSTTDLPTQETLNANIQQVLLASRPYLATPLGGMFKGAQYYLQTDPNGPYQTDTFVKGGCRSEYIILLTDGAPNQDMRPGCAAAGAPNGVCPFALPEVTASQLFQSVQPVTTFVIGFAVSQVQDAGTIYCSSLSSGGVLAAVCSDPTKQAIYGPCCELQRIAIAGGSSHAYFADTSGDLQNALGTILSLIAKNTTTRTMPAFSPVITQGNVADPNTPKTSESVFLASFIPSPGRPWSGDVQRQRYLCKSAGTTYTVQAPAPDPTLGDDFAANLNSNSKARTFVALQPDPVVDSSATIRPYVASAVGDGLGKYSAATYPDIAANVIAKITPAALGLTGTSCSYNPTGGGASKYLSAALCRDMLLDYTFAQPFSTNPGDFPFVSRAGIAFGDVFHATPIVVGPPGSLLRDDSYLGFASATAATGSGARKTIVYVATNDGILHAFWADETKLENNELWAMVPPAVMPNLLTSYPSSHQFLLDGSPVVKDVVWDRTPATQGNPGNWHTMLVAGFGPNQTGYYAVDVTNPDPTGMAVGVVPTDPPASGPPKGPIFMWQLTKMPATNAPLFGPHGAIPAITTLFFDPAGGANPREIGVAILPGGQDLAATNTACARAVKASDSAPVNTYKARTSVRCWGKTQKATDPVIGRSLSIVRLDTGEIVRVFMRVADVPVATDTLYVASPKRIIDTPLDSPMTGVPVVYPGDVGTDATKVFVGDADGTIWRFDLSNSDPAKWFGELYLDLYNQTADISPTSWGDGQPIQLSPVISLDPNGNLVLNVATGTQDVFDGTGVDYVYSITEAVNSLAVPTKLRATVNWWLDPATVTTQLGERVSGPMTVFDGVLYFATYGAAAAGAQSCTSGHGRIWGLDFVTPADTKALAKGGLPRLNPLPASHNQYVQPDESDSTLAGIVIPGVSIKATPACAGLGNPGTDSYVAGQQHQLSQGYTGGGFSVFTQLGTKGSSGAATRQFELSVPTPIAPTVIDSWAAVLE